MYCTGRAHCIHTDSMDSLNIAHSTLHQRGIKHTTSPPGNARPSSQQGSRPTQACPTPHLRVPCHARPQVAHDDWLPSCPALLEQPVVVGELGVAGLQVGRRGRVQVRPAGGASRRSRLTNSRRRQAAGPGGERGAGERRGAGAGGLLVRGGHRRAAGGERGSRMCRRGGMCAVVWQRFRWIC